MTWLPFGVLEANVGTAVDLSVVSPLCGLADTVVVIPICGAAVGLEGILGENVLSCILVTGFVGLTTVEENSGPTVGGCGSSVGG